MEPNPLKQRLARGDALFGAWIATGSAVNAEMLGHHGFDFLVLDLEHGPGDLGDAVDMLRAVQPSGTPCVVRVPWNDPVFLKRILDAGATSLMIPQVESAEEAAAAVQACRYPPQGRRGYAASAVRASNYGMTADYMRGANSNLLLVIQLESEAAVRQAASICAIEGVDVPFLGVNDMAGSIGRLEQLDAPEVRALVGVAETAMLASGKPIGTVPSAGATWQSLFETGYRFLPVASDISLMRDAARACVREQRSFRGDAADPRQGPTPSTGY